MVIGNTDMHIVTFLFIVFETVMFGYQFLLYLLRPQEKQRVYYLILLALLIIKNTASGLFPDQKIALIPVIDQYILAYGTGLIMASYFPFYFYKAYNISDLRWHAVKGIFLFLHVPFFLLFAISFFLTKNIDTAIDVGLIIPSIYGLVLGYVILSGIRRRLGGLVERREYFELIAVFLAVIPYASLAFCAYFRISQVKEVILTNGGFIFISILFIRNSIRQSRAEYKVLQEMSSSEIPVTKRSDNQGDDDEHFQAQELMTFPAKDFDNRWSDSLESMMELFKLSKREKEVAVLLVEGLTYQGIADELSIELGTVKKHTENIYKKVDVGSRKALIKSLQQ